MTEPTKIFPIIKPCGENGWGDATYRDYFHEVRPPGMTWYGYDVVILSRTEIQFTVYDMADNCYGGIGKKIASLRATVPVEATERDFSAALLRLAKLRRREEIEAAEDALIKAYAKEIRDEFERDFAERDLTKMEAGK